MASLSSTFNERHISQGQEDLPLALVIADICHQMAQRTELNDVRQSLKTKYPDLENSCQDLDSLCISYIAASIGRAAYEHVPPIQTQLNEWDKSSGRDMPNTAWHIMTSGFRNTSGNFRNFVLDRTEDRNCAKRDYQRQQFHLGKNEDVIVSRAESACAAAFPRIIKALAVEAGLTALLPALKAA